MSAMLNRTQIGIKITSKKASVAEDPKAKLMYYLYCICKVLQMDKTGQLQRLTDFANYRRLDDDDTNALLLFCVLLSPDKLNGKCIFQNDSMCINFANEFYELSAVNHTLMVSDSILIDGQRRKVEQIMTYKMSWLRINFVEPMEYFESRLRRLAGMSQRSRPSESNCVIL